MERIDERFRQFVNVATVVEDVVIATRRDGIGAYPAVSSGSEELEGSEEWTPSFDDEE